MKKRHTGVLISLIFTILVISCNPANETARQRIDLSGHWQFATDTARTGIQDKWYLADLKDSVELPGTTDSNRKGFYNTDTTTMHLNRVFKYEGPAWYRRKIVVPGNFSGKHILLTLERTKSSKLWIDSVFAGGSHILQSPQKFDVSGILTPGEHWITLCIDNSLELTPYGNVHIYSDDTQTNWNGIIGKMYLEAMSGTYISDLRVYPDINSQKIRVKMQLVNNLKINDLKVHLIVEEKVDGRTRRLPAGKYNIHDETTPVLEYDLGGRCDLWDEYRQPLYQMTAVITGGGIRDSKTVPFGMRSFTTRGTQFSINHRTTFLRGKHDACVFPLTGYPPMDVEGWERVFEIAKSYGINHYRFHSWCPPEAAFTAADRAGIYIQAEMPFWGGLDSDTVADMLRKEGYAMLDAYANHPSFVMFSHGNEIWSGHDRVEKNIVALKAYDDRPLYTMGSNNNIGYAGPGENSDFFVAARTPYSHDTILTHTRLTHAFADSDHGGILNTRTPSTMVTFDWAVAHTPMPVIGHEIGQYQVYPDYSEIAKYTGVLEPRNLEVFRDRLEKAGMADQDMAFHKASGAWAAICYKAEMEAAIRTPGFGGFQLLDLQDFPGQGTALVGMLDAFMDSKEVVSRESWRQSCNDVVVLLEFPKYCWTREEKFRGRIVVVNYSDKPVGHLAWEVTDSQGNVIKEDSLIGKEFNPGGQTFAGILETDLSSVRDAGELHLSLSLGNGKYTNTYPVWVYPPPGKLPDTGEIMVTDKINSAVLARLQQGGKVLLFPEPGNVKNNSLEGLFPPEFWNYGMFKSISERVNKPVSPGTLGILTDPSHPLFSEFPTDSHTNWQWFAIIKASHPVILDRTPDDYRPVVQVIDNLERDHKLGLIFEYQVDRGKLLVCMSRLPDLVGKPEAVQLYRSIISYMKSDAFNPGYRITADELKSNILF